jgi:dTDP-4-dehydrorhamnose reductase
MYLLTGVSGLLGLNVAKILLQDGCELTGVSLRHEVKMDGLAWLACDLGDTGALQALVRKLKPKIIIHAAAATDVDWCQKNPDAAFILNTQACGSLVSIANEVGAKIIYISTDSVFDGRKGCYSEDDEPNPLNVYARTKWEGERLVAAEATNWVVLRTNIFGWNGQNKSSLAEWIVQELRARREIIGFEDVVFSPLLASDLGRVISQIIRRDLRGLYHAGSATGISKLKFAQRLAQLFHLDENLIRPGKLADRGLSARRPLDTSLSSAGLEKDLGAPLSTIEEGLRRFHEQEKNGWAQALKNHTL